MINIGWLLALTGLRFSRWARVNEYSNKYARMIRITFATVHSNITAERIRPTKD